LGQDRAQHVGRDIHSFIDCFTSHYRVSYLFVPET
jgi:hypothetical protein